MAPTEDSRRFAGRTVAVTGAGGFIGNAICRRLVAQGAEVTGIDIDESLGGRVGATGARFAAADITDSDALVPALDGVELVIHTAAYVHDWGTMPEFVRVNVGGTARVVDAAAEVGAARVVHLSSVVVYGYDDASEQDESVFLRSYGIPYIDTKSASDRLARRRGAVVVRPGDVYGPGSVPWVLRPLGLARSGQLAVPRGERLMLPVYVDDLVEAVLVGALAGEPGEAYTAWDDGRPVSFGEHFDRLARMIDARPARRLPRGLLELLGGAATLAARFGAGPPRFSSRAVTFLDRRGTVSTQRMRALGWEPQVSYERGMALTESWLRAEGLL